MDYDQLGSGEKEWVRDEIDNMSMNESDSNYFDKIPRHTISSGMWRYTGKEQGGKVYRNLNNGQILGFIEVILTYLEKTLVAMIFQKVNEDIYDKFLDNPSSPKGRAKS